MSSAENCPSEAGDDRGEISRWDGSDSNPFVNNPLLRFWLFPEIGFSTKVFFSFLRNCVVLALSFNYVYKPSILQFWNSSLQCGVRKGLSSLFEVVLYASKIVTGTRLGQKFQNAVITARHPLCPVSAHGFVGEEPAETIFDYRHCVDIELQYEPMIGQTLSLVNHDWLIVAGAPLPLGVAPLKTGCDTVSPARVSRRSTVTVFETSAAGYKKRPARFDGNHSLTDEFQLIMNASSGLDDSIEKQTICCQVRGNWPGSPVSPLLNSASSAIPCEWSSTGGVHA